MFPRNAVRLISMQKPVGPAKRHAVQNCQIRLPQDMGKIRIQNRFHGHVDIRHTDIGPYSFLREFHDVADGIRKGLGGEGEGEEVFIQKYSAKIY